jgi:pre-mRNA-processing factor 19
MQATSIPGLLGLFQNEWDDLMLETYTLKQHLDATRQELSQALYQHDAACRVIARLIKERDTALEQVSTAQAAGAQNAVADGEMEDVEEAGMTPAIISKMEATSKTLQKGRRKRPAPDELASKDDIAAYDADSSHTIHKSDKPGILCVALHPKKQNMVLTGGVDKVAQLFNRKSGKVESTLSGHGKKVTDVLFHPTDDVLFTTSADKTAKIWAKSGKSYKAAHTIDCHSAEITGCSLHATNDYLATCSTDASWAFHDINTGKTLMHVKDPSVDKGFNCTAFHPDGLILGTGTLDNLIRIWDMKTQQNVASFEGHTDVVNSISFSENG